MRKWMRERAQRRKSKAEPESRPTEQAPAPLQPAYFDGQQPESTTTPEAERTETANFQPEAAPPAMDQSPAQQEMDDTQAETQPAAPESGATGPVRRRRRRGRGGRGRGAEKTQPAPAGAPPAERPQETAAPVSTVAEAPRASKGAVVLAVGLPGSGKSSWFKRHKISPLSSDMLRALLFDDPKEQRFQDLVFSNLRSMLKARLIARRPLNYVDATNLSPHERHTWIKMARDYGYDVHAVYFDVPVDVCMERNRRRERNVPEDIMRRMASKLRPPTFEEGFSKITVVRVKKKGGGPEEQEGLGEQTA
jgi:predicted kinase